MRNRIGRPRFNQGPASGRGAGTFAVVPAIDVTFTPTGNISSANVQDAIVELDQEKVAKAGDSMTGFLTLSAAPTSNLHAATKKYVDDSIVAGGGYTDEQAMDAVAGMIQNGTGITWTYNDAANTLTPTVTAAGVFIGDAPPVSPTAGQLWYEADSGYMFIYYNDGSSAQWVPVFTNPALPPIPAPVLDLITDGSDNTPDFTLTGELVVGDTVRFQYSTSSSFTGASELTNDIDASEDAANAISFSTGALANGTWYFRARIERPSRIASGWSNIETIAISVVTTSAEVAQFLSRTSGLDGTHTAAYTALIDGLVADGLWARLDAIYVFATNSSANALQNLKSSSYTGTIGGSLTFTADDGFTTAGAGNRIDTHLNAFAGGVNYTQNSAHMSVWMFNDNGSMVAPVGTLAGGTGWEYVIPHLGGNAYFRINTNEGCNISVPSGVGLFVATRISSSTSKGYRNGVFIASNTGETSIALNNSNFSFPDLSATGGPDIGNIVCGGSFGSSLDDTQNLALYNRLRTYMTAVGVP